MDRRMGGRGNSGEFETLEPTIPALRTEVTPVNGSDQNLTPTCHPRNMIPHLLMLIIAFVGLAGNTVVLWLLGFRIRRNAISVYILNLAAADSLFLCCHFINSLIIVCSIYFDLPPSVIYILASVSIISYITGLSMLSAISTERCMSITWPIWYRCHRPRHTSAVVCALIWALSMFLGILRWSICYKLQKDFRGYWCKRVDLFISAWLMFLCVILSGSSLALLCRIFCGSHRKPMTRLYMTILLTVLVFLLCGLPMGILWFLLFWIHNIDSVLCLYVVLDVLSSINSCANPFIYFFVGSFRQWLQQRQTFKTILERALQDECGSSLPQGTLEMSGSRGEQ